LVAQQQRRQRPRCIDGSWLFGYYFRGGRTYF
jgi:hypothetical protein